MNKETLIKYLNNGCSDSEFDEFVSWVKKEAGSETSQSWSRNLWKTFEPSIINESEATYNVLLDKIHHRINLQNNQTSKGKIITFSTVVKWFNRVAAVLFIPLVILTFYWYTTSNLQAGKLANLTVDSLEVIAPVGSRTVVELSDGTQVTLNYGSKLKYPWYFTGNKREVTLVGEGYFDVAHNPDKPFIVKTGKVNVKALGTEFNVRAYPEYDIVATTLVEGKVVVEKVNADNQIQNLGTMVPGQHVEYNFATGEMTSINDLTYKYIAWKDGKLIFDNTPIVQVAEELGKMYNVDIDIADNIKDLTYTVTFGDDPLFLILDLMTEITPITYKVFPRKKLEDGTYSKQRIKIEKTDKV
ncbi:MULTISPECIES: FecR family protein [Prolixibacteraceae]|nr:FecR domain-containing protein [Maribellus luteus]